LHHIKSEDNQKLKGFILNRRSKKIPFFGKWKKCAIAEAKKSRGNYFEF